MYFSHSSARPLSIKRHHRGHSEDTRFPDCLKSRLVSFIPYINDTNSDQTWVHTYPEHPILIRINILINVPLRSISQIDFPRLRQFSLFHIDCTSNINLKKKSIWKPKINIFFSHACSLFQILCSLFQDLCRLFQTTYCSSQSHATCGLMSR